MALKFKVGAKVEQVMPKPMVGVVERVAVVEDDVKYLVTAGDRSRWFSGDELKAAAE